MKNTFTFHRGRTVPLDRDNIDTDQIIPKQFLKSIKKSGFGPNLFDAWRYEDEGFPGQDVSQRKPNKEFILNQERFNGADILISKKNFGCGSSREHAVWGMRQLGIKACIGTGFAGIFYDNARKNGLALPIVSHEIRDKLLQFAKNANSLEVSIEIDTQTITAGEISAPFEMDEATRTSLIQGRDDTLDTLKYASAIHDFESSLSDQMRVSVIK